MNAVLHLAVDSENMSLFKQPLLPPVILLQFSLSFAKM